MDSKLSASMAALRKVVKSPHPAMFWQETMGHVAVVLDHLQELISDGSTAPAIEVQPGDHSELRRIAVALKNPLLNGQEASDLMVRYEALTMPDHIIAMIDGLPQRVLDKQCRDDVARALGLCPNQERGFAWSYLLASIKSCVKASEDSAQAQHSVPGDIMRDAQRYRWLRDQQFYFSFSTENSDAGISSCTAGMSSRFKNLSWVDAAIDSAIAAAPGKEGV